MSPGLDFALFCRKPSPPPGDAPQQRKRSTSRDGDNVSLAVQRPQHQSGQASPNYDDNDGSRAAYRLICSCGRFELELGHEVSWHKTHCEPNCRWQWDYLIKISNDRDEVRDQVNG